MLGGGIQAGERSRPMNEGCDRGLKVVVKDPEEFEQALREFRRKVQEQGLVREMRRRAHYVPPAEARKIKSLRARRRRTR
jgi:small subunit ribosomal protein S21